jgi:DNA-binding PadR family transcriptional regulator
MSAGAPERLSMNELVVLALIDEEPRHGFAVARELNEDSMIGEAWRVRAPLVYRAVDRLAELWLIEATRTEPGSKGPARTIYRSTPRGARAVTAWLAEPVAHPRDVRTELVAKLLLLARRELDSTGLLRAQLEHFGPVAAGLATRAAAAEGPERVVTRWRLESMNSITLFLRGLLDEHTQRRD